jgi:GT2 family glycosyltransferase
LSRTPDASIVVSTYAWPEALAAVLRGLSEQHETDFEVVVTEDGSDVGTAEAVSEFRSPFGDRLRHVTQADKGFRLALARNRGAMVARGRVLLFVDGDCVPRRGFSRAVLRALRPGWLLGGKRVRLSERLTRRVLAERLPVGRWTLADFILRGRGDVTGLGGLTRRDRRFPGREGLPEFIPDREGWGFFLAVRREDFERVNGYDARFVGWGGEDVDLATRLRRLGLRAGWAGPSSTLIHLWHPDRTDHGRPNSPLLEETVAAARVEALYGLRELAAELAAQESANSTTGSGATPFSSGGT